MERVFEVTRRKQKNRGRKGWVNKKTKAEKRALKALNSAQPLIPSLPTTNVDEQIVKREAPEEEDEYVWKATNEATKVEDDPIRSKRPMEGIKMVAAQEPEINKRKRKNRGRKGWYSKKQWAEIKALKALSSAQPPLISPPSTVKTEAPEESKDSVCRSWMGSRGSWADSWADSHNFSNV
uniref:Ribosome biogenesis regulatory protein n=1 Tax=Caenorhabditis tropicalis TaxID=1561998 RepID=A0A1I7UK59_9PELO